MQDPRRGELIGNLATLVSVLGASVTRTRPGPLERFAPVPPPCLPVDRGSAASRGPKTSASVCVRDPVLVCNFAGLQKLHLDCLHITSCDKCSAQRRNSLLGFSQLHPRMPVQNRNRCQSILQFPALKKSGQVFKIERTPASVSATPIKDQIMMVRLRKAGGRAAATLPSAKVAV